MGSGGVENLGSKKKGIWWELTILEIRPPLIP